MPTYFSTTQYTHTTLGDALSALSARLSDPSFSYWTGAEMGSRIVQAIRMWQALTGFYRERAEFTLDEGFTIGDLHTILPQRFGFSITDQQTIKSIQHHLLEPATGNSWTGSTQFSLASVSRSLQRRRNQFLLDSSIVNRYLRLDTPSQPIGRIPLPDSVTDVRRAAWLDTFTGQITPIFRDDEFAGVSFNPGWPQRPGIPQIFSAAVTPPVSLQLIPPPMTKGALDMVVVETGPNLDPTSKDGVLLMVPDDFAWAVEFGALADLLATDGLTRDPLRAQYAEQVYMLAVEAAKHNPSVLMVQLNGEVLFTNSIFDLDTFMPSWESSPNQPICAALAGRNLIAFAPIPDTPYDYQHYGVTLDYLPNIPVPSVLTDYLQIGREHVGVVLDLAQHLCAFKQGGSEFKDTQPLFQNFLRLVAVQNQRLAASTFYNEIINSPALLLNMVMPDRGKEKAATQ